MIRILLPVFRLPEKGGSDNRLARRRKRPFLLETEPEAQHLGQQRKLITTVITLVISDHFRASRARRRTEGGGTLLLKAFEASNLDPDVAPFLQFLLLDDSCLYRVVIVLCVLLPLFRLLLSLQFDLHGVCDQGSEDGVGLGRLDERVLKARDEAES